MRIGLILLAVGCGALLCAEDATAVPRDSNFGNTSGYNGTQVQAQLFIPFREDVENIHFIRDNNDPRVVTRTYYLRHAEPYELRDYLRQMVQSKRVGNTSLQQAYPGNTAGGASPAGVTATVSSPELTTPPTAQPGYDPALQLGSNTAVECLKYVDGTGLLIVSAEEYRFRDQENGLGIDSIVDILDQPGITSSSGFQTFLYMPRFVPARNLMPLIQNAGMNVPDVTELWQGQDLVAYDPDLNWLIFYTANYSCDNIAGMLEKYDVPIPQVRLKITVYEVYSENDDRIGIDFQAWKNNEGADFFSVGGRMRNNWAALYSGGMAQDYGSERTSFYNFNPKWNSRYLDFLVSRGQAQIATTGELCIRNNTAALLDRSTQIFYVDVSQPVPDARTLPDTGVGPYELLSAIIGRDIPADDIPVGKGNQQITTGFSGFGFRMTVENASVNLDQVRFTVTLANSSLLGFESSGRPRISRTNTVSQDVSLPLGTDRFVIGGLKKQETVESSTGVPVLSDIPWLGYLFSSRSTSVKHSELIVVAECIWDAVNIRPVHSGMTTPVTQP